MNAGHGKWLTWLGGMKRVKKLLNLFVDICLLRAAPQALPASTFLLLTVAVLSLITGVVVIGNHFANPLLALLAQLLDLAVMALLVGGVLRLQGRLPRFYQSMTALFGSSVLLNLAVMPVQLLIGDDPAKSPMGDVGVLLFLILVVWGLVVIGHILRHTFEMRFSSGLLIAIAYFFVINALVQSLFVTGS